MDSGTKGGAKYHQEKQQKMKVKEVSKITQMSWNQSETLCRLVFHEGMTTKHNVELENINVHNTPLMECQKYLSMVKIEYQISYALWSSRNIVL